MDDITKCVMTPKMFSDSNRRPLTEIHEVGRTTGGVSVTLASHWLTYILENRTINRAKTEN